MTFLSQDFNAVRRSLPLGKPSFDPVQWSSADFANCYTYALDIPDHGWGVPGQLALPYEKRDAPDWRAFIQNQAAFFDLLFDLDGLVKVRLEETNPEDHVIAFFCVSRISGFSFLPSG